MLPPATDRLVEKYRIFILGGPLTTIVTFLLSLAFLSLVGIPDFDKASIPVMGVLAIAVFSINLACLYGCLAPNTQKGLTSDGALLWQLRKTGPEQERMLALLQLAKAIYAGERARDWPAALVEKLGAPSDGAALELRARYLRFYYLADQGHYETAWDELVRAENIGSELGDKAGYLREAIQSEKAFAAAWFLHDPNRLPSPDKITDTSHVLVEGVQSRAQAAVALQQGRIVEALTFIEQARKNNEVVAARFRVKGATDSAWLSEMEAEARQRLASESNDYSAAPPYIR